MHRRRTLAICCLALASACSKGAGSGEDASAGGTSGGGAGDSANGGAGGTAGSATNGGAGGTAGGGSDGGNVDGGTTIVTVDGGIPTTLATAEANGPVDIAVDGTHVYWTDIKAKAVMKVPKPGGPTVVLAANQDHLSALVVDGTHVYWVDSYNGPTGSVMKVPLGGGTPVVIAAQQYLPNSIAVDAMNVYWTTAGNYALNPGGTVMKASLATGDITTLVPSQLNAGSIAVGGTSVYSTTIGEASSGAIVAVPISGGSATAVAYASGPGPIATDGADVYWASDDVLSRDNRITKRGQAGGSPTIVFSSQVALGDIIVSGRQIYGVSSRAIVRVSVDGGPAISIGTGDQPLNLAADETHLYWTTQQGTVRVLAKP